ncbi:hypothetical protein HK105_202145 [Polyrhizophydium stewartii]|uniref:Uncharacterized protein n=1 Tax=Polyrhizophydium stewartii TaxID=2732419 RepID=A0ABR4NFC1_9FUNG
MWSEVPVDDRLDDFGADADDDELYDEEPINTWQVVALLTPMLSKAVGRMTAMHLFKLALRTLL